MSISNINKINNSLESINVSAKELVALQEKVAIFSKDSLDEAKKQTAILERQEVERNIEKIEKQREKQIREVIFDINEEIDSVNNSSDFYLKAWTVIKLDRALIKYDVNTDLVQNFDEKKYINECIKKVRNLKKEVCESKNQSHIYFLELISFDYESLKSNIKFEDLEVNSDEKNPGDFINELKLLLDTFNNNYETIISSGNVSKKQISKFLEEFYTPLIRKSNDYQKITKKKHSFSLQPNYFSLTPIFIVLFVSLFFLIYVKNQTVGALIFIFTCLVILFIPFVLLSNRRIIRLARNKELKKIINVKTNEIIEVLNKNYNELQNAVVDRKTYNQNIIQNVNIEINKMNEKIDYISREYKDISLFFPKKFEIIS